MNKDFSERLKNLLQDRESSAFKIFEFEIKTIYNRLKSKYSKLWSFDEAIRVIELYNPKIHEKIDPGVSAFIDFSGLGARIVFNYWGIKNNYELDKKLFNSSFEDYIRDKARHEVSHLVAKILYQENSDEFYGHGKLFLDIYLPLRKELTDWEFIIRGDGKYTNFTADSQLIKRSKRFNGTLKYDELSIHDI